MKLASFVSLIHVRDEKQFGELEFSTSMRALCVIKSEIFREVKKVKKEKYSFDFLIK